MTRTLENAFPEVESGVIPLCGQVVIQIIHIPEAISSSGIILAKEAHDNEQFTRKIAKIIAMGPTAFANKLTGEKWEGADIKLGDYIMAPHVAGTRFTRKLDKKDKSSPIIHFVACNDSEIRFKVKEEEVLNFENDMFAGGTV